jgi:hypothetical protein
LFWQLQITPNLQFVPFINSYATTSGLIQRIIQRKTISYPLIKEIHCKREPAAIHTSRSDVIFPPKKGASGSA